MMTQHVKLKLYFSLSYSTTECYDTYHKGYFVAGLLLSSSEHGESSSCSDLKILVLLATKQYQQLQSIIAIGHKTLLDLRNKSLTPVGNWFPTLMQLFYNERLLAIFSVLTSLHEIRLHMHSVAACLIWS